MIDQDQQAIQTLQSIGEAIAGGEEIGPEKELFKTLVDGAANILAFTSTVPEAKELRDQVSTVAHYFKLRGAQVIDANMLMAQMFRSERWIGSVLSDTEKNKGGRPRTKETLYQMGEGLVSTPQTLAQVGITKFQSRLWQKMFMIPEDTFEEWVMYQTHNEEPLTYASLLRSDIKPVSSSTGKKKGSDTITDAVEAERYKRTLVDIQTFLHDHLYQEGLAVRQVLRMVENALENGRAP